MLIFLVLSILCRCHTELGFEQGREVFGIFKARHTGNFRHLVGGGFQQIRGILHPLVHDILFEILAGGFLEQDL